MPAQTREVAGGASPTAAAKRAEPWRGQHAESAHRPTAQATGLAALGLGSLVPTPYAPPEASVCALELEKALLEGKASSLSEVDLDAAGRARCQGRRAAPAPGGGGGG